MASSVNATSAVSRLGDGTADGGVSGAGGGVRGAAEKALDLLAALASGPEPQRLLDLARQTEMAKPTAHRMLNTLCAAGYAEAAPGGYYHAGPKLLGIAAAVLSGSPERPFVRTALVDLQTRTGHSAHYAVRHGAAAIYLDKVEAEQAYKINTRVGQELPLATSAVGRALMSTWSRADVDRELGNAADDHLLAVMDAGREAGYFVEDAEVEPNIRSIAVPVVDGLGSVIGAIGISGLTFTLGAESVPVFGPLLVSAAEQVTAALRGELPGPSTTAIGE